MRVVLPESADPRVVEAAVKLRDLDILQPILIGAPGELAKSADERGMTLDGIEIIDHLHSPMREQYVETYYELRKHKGLTLQEASSAMDDSVFFAAMMLRTGAADGAVSGSLSPTAKVVQAGLRIIGLAPGIRTVSSCFVMIMPDKRWGHDGVMMFADCAIVPNPDAQALSDIAIATAATARSLVGIEPVIAMLSFSTKGSASHPDADKVIEATRLVREKAPQLRVDGELQADAAIIAKVGQQKAPGSTVAGHANTLIFPDLDAANIGYKLVQRLAGAEAIGPFLQGLIKPANDLSRGCSVDDIVNVSIVTAVQAQVR